VAVNHIAKWNGSSWAPLDGGMNAEVAALAAFDDGSGPALYAGGGFTAAGGVAANHIARWAGSSWSPLGSGVGEGDVPSVAAFAVFDVGNGPALCAGGSFESAYDSSDSFLALWGCDATAPIFPSLPAVLAMDRLGSSPGEIVTFSVSADDDHDVSPEVECIPPSGSFFPRGTTLVSCTATDASGNESTSQFTVTVLPKTRRP
jgi:hypothetical protein